MAQNKEIKIVLHLPESAQSVREFEKKICAFYAAQIEKRLRPLPKEQSLEILHSLAESHNT